MVGGGGEVKAFLAETEVLVNGEPDARRGRQLHPGDVVRIGGEEYRWSPVRQTFVRRVARAARVG